jgi:hypothetical protein
MFYGQRHFNSNSTKSGPTIIQALLWGFFPAAFGAFLLISMKHIEYT